LGWFLDPDDLSILVFLCDRQPILMEKTDILPALAGVELKLTVDNVFSWLKMA
jgi:Uma2 family endonuclease